MSLGQCTYVPRASDSCPDRMVETAAEFCGWVASALVPVAYAQQRCGDTGLPACGQITPGTGCRWSGYWEMPYYSCTPPQGPNPCAGAVDDCNPPEARIGTAYDSGTCQYLSNGYVCGQYINATVYIRNVFQDTTEPGCVFRLYSEVVMDPVLNICNGSFNRTSFTAFPTDGIYDTTRGAWYRLFEARTCRGWAQALVNTIRGRYTEYPLATEGWSYELGVA